MATSSTHTLLRVNVSVSGVPMTGRLMRCSGGTKNKKLGGCCELSCATSQTPSEEQQLVEEGGGACEVLHRWREKIRGEATPACARG